MNCEQCNSHQEDFLAGELTESAKQEFLEHVTSCETCKEALKNTALIWNLVHASCISPADAVLKEEALQAINQMINEPEALHLKQEMERSLWQQKLAQIKKRKILLQAAAVIVIMISSGIFLTPGIFKSQPLEYDLDTVEKQQIASEVKTESKASETPSMRGTKTVVGEVQQTAEKQDNAVAVDSAQAKQNSNDAFDRLPALPEKQLLNMAKKMSGNKADKQQNEIGNAVADTLPAKEVHRSGAMPENTGKQETAKTVDAAHTEQPAAAPVLRKNAVEKTQKKYFQQVVLLPDGAGTVLAYVEMMFPEQPAGAGGMTVNLEPVQQSENMIKLSGNRGFMSFYQSSAVSDQMLGYVVLTDQQKSAKLPLSAGNAVSFEQALPRVQMAFIRQYLANPDSIKIAGDTRFLLALIRVAEKEVNENGDNKEEMKKALSVLYQMVSE